MPTRVEWHPGAFADLEELDPTVRQRVTDAVGRLRFLDDPKQRLLPYVETLKGYWKLRVGDYRVVCQLKRDAQGQLIVVINVVHRGEAYRSRSVRTIQRRSED
ncbi:MAG: type II toxin-antitoxin system RelE/ParE family toxin [Hyphomicrobiales bacterium]|nr:MAG: type II toxin-antitoxin system RelE/ParE family toxin [Hyphomicrobiales bacterium]